MGDFNILIIIFMRDLIFANHKITQPDLMQIFIILVHAEGQFFPNQRTEVPIKNSPPATGTILSSERFTRACVSCWLSALVLLSQPLQNAIVTNSAAQYCLFILISLIKPFWSVRHHSWGHMSAAGQSTLNTDPLIYRIYV